MVVSLFLGMELFAEVAGDPDLIDRTFDSAHQLTALLGSVLPAADGTVASAGKDAPT